MPPADCFEVDATLWCWQPNRKGGGWHFVTIDGQTAAEMRYAALGRTGGFGSIRVDVRIGGTRWQTSVFPHKESGGFILPVKADVRKREGLSEGDAVTVSLAI
ncbi:MAG: DUF1905 domain-containing protein [Rhizorhabdus sp.]|uniref:DUF1905 domain-containing protein n=1 Tax=Rhizorhabdus sp. TaxID=1968843 RepID=UPI001B4C0000|nr:DUF1905 domain-containing protein [Rhizorhabdus sp.]MBP8232932.1 DUF1905 domain-containing protein [Rhizorhabdus sp.]